MPTHRDLPHRQPPGLDEPAASRDERGGTVELWSLGATLGAIGAVAGTPIWAPLGEGGLLLFLLSLITLRRLTR